MKTLSSFMRLQNLKDMLGKITLSELKYTMKVNGNIILCSTRKRKSVCQFWSDQSL